VWPKILVGGYLPHVKAQLISGWEVSGLLGCIDRRGTGAGPRAVLLYLREILGIGEGKGKRSEKKTYCLETPRASAWRKADSGLADKGEILDLAAPRCFAGPFSAADGG